MVHFASACSLFFYRGPKSVFGASLVLVERVQGSPKQILALCFPSHDLTIDGVRWVECSVRGGGYRGIGLWGKVRVSCRGVLERWFGLKPWGRGGIRLAGKCARIMASIAMTIRAVSKSVMVSKFRGNPVSDQFLNSRSSIWAASGNALAVVVATTSSFGGILFMISKQ
ncbi:hypothetical protein Tco_0737481 [Tanacetum coccineum]